MTTSPRLGAGRDDRGRVALVVDDVESTRLIVGTWLGRAGFAVVEAGSVTEALRRLDAHVPDVLVLDVNLPDGSGLDVCERVKSTPESSCVPVLHISATATQARERAAGLDGGADAYLVEPLDREEFVSTVFALLRQADARRDAERRAQRLSALHAATLAVNAARSYPDLLDAAVRGAVALAGGDAAVVVAGRQHVYVASGSPGRDPRPPRTLSRAEAARLLALDARGGRVALPDLPEAPGAVELLGSGGPGAADVLLLLAAGRVDEPARALLGELLDAADRAVERLETLEREHEIALVLQRALLPETLPTPAGLEVAARYVASAEHAEVGGDFYEVVELDGGQIAAAIGDVQGHSLRAAAVMAELRHALRAYAFLGVQPAELVVQLNEMLLRFHPEVVASVCYLLLEPAGGRLRYVNAGHIPPLLVDASGGVRVLTEARPLLGVPFPAPRASADVLPPGGTLVLVTDGLVERRDQNVQTGLDALARLCADRSGEALEDLAERILAGVGPSTPSDDIAVLLLRRPV